MKNAFFFKKKSEKQTNPQTIETWSTLALMRTKTRKFLQKHSTNTETDSAFGNKVADYVQNLPSSYGFGIDFGDRSM